MQILHILKRDPDETTGKIIEAHKKTGAVTVIDLRVDKDYEKIIRLAESGAKIICW